MQREETSGLGRGWSCRRKRYELLEPVSEGSGQHRKKEKGVLSIRFASGSEKGQERVDTDNEKFEDGKKRS